MNSQRLTQTVADLFSDDKGLLAMDESTATCNKRFLALEIPQTEEARREYRELIITTPKLSESIGGLILYDETIRQKGQDGRSLIQTAFDAGMIPGIKVDVGAKPMANYPGETITEGLDGLRDRLVEYSTMGARFAKWRAVFTIGEGLPSQECIASNANALARYAALCQEVDLVPIVEPEVLMTGFHDIAQCEIATFEVLHTVFRHLVAQKVLLEGTILKPNMVLPGLACPIQANTEEVAGATIRCLLRSVPAVVPAVAFLSGGQSCQLASARLNLMNLEPKARRPWAVAFSFSRAIQQPALEIWRGQRSNVGAAQAALLHRATCNRAARQGMYSMAVEASGGAISNQRVSVL
jgi:fructose-bisphosphate aldolase class I